MVCLFKLKIDYLLTFLNKLIESKKFQAFYSQFYLVKKACKSWSMLTMKGRSLKIFGKKLLKTNTNKVSNGEVLCGTIFMCTMTHRCAE